MFDMKTAFIGVDTAESSGAIFLNPPGRIKRVFLKTDRLIEVIEIVRSWGYEPVVTIEKQSYQTNVRARRHGVIMCYGGYRETLGICKALKVRIIEVAPRTWQAFYKFKKGVDTKLESFRVAKEIYPEFDFKNKHDQSDAGLICEYGRLKFLRGE